MPQVKSKVKQNQAVLKTPEERTAFVKTMKEKFYNLGCYPEQYDAMAKFFKILDEYAKDSVSASGKISFPECPSGGRDICYILSNRKNIENVVHFLMKAGSKDL